MLGRLLLGTATAMTVALAALIKVSSWWEVLFRPICYWNALAIWPIWQDSLFMHWPLTSCSTPSLVIWVVEFSREGPSSIYSQSLMLLFLLNSWMVAYSLPFFSNQILTPFLPARGWINPDTVIKWQSLVGIGLRTKKIIFCHKKVEKKNHSQK